MSHEEEYFDAVKSSLSDRSQAIFSISRPEDFEKIRDCGIYDLSQLPEIIIYPCILVAKKAGSYIRYPSAARRALRKTGQKEMIASIAKLNSYREPFAFKGACLFNSRFDGEFVYENWSFEIRGKKRFAMRFRRLFSTQFSDFKPTVKDPVPQ